MNLHALEREVRSGIRRNKGRAGIRNDCSEVIAAHDVEIRVVAAGAATHNEVPLTGNIDSPIITRHVVALYPVSAAGDADPRTHAAAVAVLVAGIACDGTVTPDGYAMTCVASRHTAADDRARSAIDAVSVVGVRRAIADCAAIIRRIQPSGRIPTRRAISNCGPLETNNPVVLVIPGSAVRNRCPRASLNASGVVVLSATVRDGRPSPPVYSRDGIP